MSRARILADLRAGLARPAREALEHAAPPGPAAPVPSPLGPSLAEELQARFEALGGRWHRASTGESVAGVVAPLVPADQAVLVSRDPAGLLARLGLADRLRARGIRVTEPGSEAVEPNRTAVTVTGVTLAIAESGTLGLLAVPGQGRLASVIAPIHVALITPDQIVATQGEYLARARDALAGGTSSAGILITGPSRTADIEGQLIVGVHGPGEIHAILVG